MILAIDIGNTNIKIAGLESTRVVFCSRISTRVSATQEDYLLQMRGLLASRESVSFSGSVLSSVVPRLTPIFSALCREFSGEEPLIISAGLDTGLTLRVTEPGRVGRDRLADAAGAAALYPLPLVTIDLGTATTLSVVDAQRNFLGGMIVPGVKTSSQALAGRTAQLPEIPMEAPSELIGRNTESALQSGLMNGTAALLDGLVLRISEELGQPVLPVLTGGMARFIAPLCRCDHIYDEHLMLKGMAVLYERSRRAKREE